MQYLLKTKHYQGRVYDDKRKTPTNSEHSNNEKGSSPKRKKSGGKKSLSNSSEMSQSISSDSRS